MIDPLLNLLSPVISNAMERPSVVILFAVVAVLSWPKDGFVSPKQLVNRVATAGGWELIAVMSLPAVALLTTGYTSPDLYLLGVLLAGVAYILSSALDDSMTVKELFNRSSGFKKFIMVSGVTWVVSFTGVPLAQAVYYALPIAGVIILGDGFLREKNRSRD